jgi:hypothetical protein
VLARTLSLRFAGNFAGSQEAIKTRRLEPVQALGISVSQKLLVRPSGVTTNMLERLLASALPYYPSAISRWAARRKLALFSPACIRSLKLLLSQGDHRIVM